MRHVELILQQCGLANSIKVKPLSAPGESKQRWRNTEEPIQDPKKVTRFTSICMRVNYLAACRSDIQFVAKGLARDMSKPTASSFDNAKHLAWYFLGRPRVVQCFIKQDEFGSYRFRRC